MGIRVFMKAFQGGVLLVIILLAMTSGIAAGAKMGTLNVSSVPPLSQILLNGSPVGFTPDSIPLPVGYYALKLTYPDYKDYTKTVRIRNNVTTTVSAMMKPIPVLKVGSLNVSSVPPDTTLYLNGSDEGNVPAGGNLIPNLPIGHYEVKLTKPGYTDWIKIVRVYNGTTTQVRAVLQGFSGVYTGALNVSSIPSGAMLYVNNSPKGPTPQFIPNLPVGVYVINLTLPGYTDYGAEVNVTSGNTTEVIVVMQALPPQPRVEVGSLEIISDPVGASVYLNNSYRNVTPVTIPNLTVGTYKLKLTKPGYADFNKNDVTITDGQTTQLYIFMQGVPLPPAVKKGNIYVDSFPQGASIFVNNSSQQSTPWLILDLPIGWYEIRLSKPGYLDWNKTIKVQDSQTYPLYAFLQPIPPGTLIINSNPPGAEIYLVDPNGMGSYPGFTNKTLSNIMPGLYWIKVQQYGFGVNYTNAMVDPGNVTVVNFTLPNMCVFPYTYP
jgi:hypothetical protein